ncbi:MAG: Hsp20/alpha crystallin family protein [SAR324 cluster bacterium]|nr:Hsp20/alpha crystallin family protein [SAR324 cluster bacterium]
MFGSFSTTLDTLLALQDAMDRSMKSDYYDMNTSGRGVFPTINLFEQEDNLMLVAELPGIQKEDLKLEVKNNLLRLAGERKIEYGKDLSIHRRERRSSNFDRSFKLPFAVESDKIKAEYKNGLLAVTLPRAEADKPRKISIS